MEFVIGVAAWLTLGALIGRVAAAKRGFSPAAGMLGGIALGCASPLMFFVSGNRKRCANCAEWIQSQAKACRFCGYGAAAPR